jgi:hypothetical protein
MMHTEHVYIATIYSLLIIIIEPELHFIPRNLNYTYVSVPGREFPQ